MNVPGTITVRTYYVPAGVTVPSRMRAVARLENGRTRQMTMPFDHGSRDASRVAAERMTGMLGHSTDQLTKIGPDAFVINTDAPIRPAPERVKIHSGRFAHDTLPELPCASRATWHLRTNNLLALQVAFQCGTIHHRCAGVSLAKATDTDPVPYAVNNGGHRVFRYLSLWSGPLTDQTREDLYNNDLRGLSSLFYLIANDPTPGR